jgi:hypothetical protein
VARLAYSKALQGAAKQGLGRRLNEIFSRYPRKRIGARIALSDLKSYLSLPIWQKRHELYAVWIATEIVNALPSHLCELHHDAGKIVFAFRETLVATVTSAWPPVRLISEHREPLSAPVGKGRTSHVQPDYGLWREQDGTKRCGLIVEVKHYKRSAPSSFSDVLTDYSRAFPKASVYLVNHGPIGDVTSSLPNDLRTRCHSIENLTAFDVLARERLQRAVQQYVGEPWVAIGKRGAGQSDTVLAVDVSGSMSSYFGKPDLLHIIREIVDDRCDHAALIDVSVRALMPLNRLPEALTSMNGVDTKLSDPIRALLDTFGRVLVVTDDDVLFGVEN